MRVLPREVCPRVHREARKQFREQKHHPIAAIHSEGYGHDCEEKHIARKDNDAITLIDACATRRHTPRGDEKNLHAHAPDATSCRSSAILPVPKRKFSPKSASQRSSTVLSKLYTNEFTHPTQKCGPPRERTLYLVRVLDVGGYLSSLRPTPPPPILSTHNPVLQLQTAAVAIMLCVDPRQHREGVYWYIAPAPTRWGRLNVSHSLAIATGYLVYTSRASP
ncbi:hypothetical protein BJ138DRAFT_1113036 [Hygrophoropsis aurantiaca]|uniref:Uncharacterized protein n=1 Tax=Hygrophoropsis aurantiaca TaxID=72124 RepID=A0ACB8AE10_9AGAM|nr:hypothetical protein BJ138DRAFT_1113036 [Hygrophoropsis aurantiaca]